MSTNNQLLRMGRPLWMELHRPRRRYPSLRGRRMVEVAIVGGGITGSAAAALFAEAGVSVALLESQLVGRGSTGASSALLLQEPDLGLSELAQKYGTSTARRIWRLSDRALRTFLSTLRRLRISCDCRTQASVYFARSTDGVARLQTELRLRRAAGFSVEWLTPRDLRRLAGLAAYGGIRTTGSAQIDPYRATTGLLDIAAQHGAEIFERTMVRQIIRTRSGVRIRTTQGSVEAATVIVATGYATERFRPLAGRFQMDRTYVLATPKLRPAQIRELGIGPVMVWDTERPYHYARWTPDRRLILGGGDVPVRPGSRRAAFASGVKDLREHFESVFPALADIGIEYAWEGLFAKTADSLPLVGPHRRYPSHLFALGYGGNGMTFGYLAAEMLLEQFGGKHSRDHALFAFSR